jgi:hypothetical protein
MCTVRKQYLRHDIIASHFPLIIMLKTVYIPKRQECESNTEM